MWIVVVVIVVVCWFGWDWVFGGVLFLGGHATHFFFLIFNFSDGEDVERLVDLVFQNSRLMSKMGGEGGGIKWRGSRDDGIAA